LKIFILDAPGNAAASKVSGSPGGDQKGAAAPPSFSKIFI